MAELLKTVAAPVIGLAGTVVAALFGYRQWKKQQDTARYGSFLTERQTAYKSLWPKLEAVHIYVRTRAGGPFDTKAFGELVRVVNIHMIEVGLHLDRGEKKRVNDYMTALEQMGQILAENADPSTQQEVQRTLYITAEMPNDVVANVEGLREAYAAVDQQRESLIQHFREVLGAHLFQ